MKSKKAFESLKQEYYVENGEHIIVFKDDDERLDIIEKDLEQKEKQDEVLNIFKSIIKRKDAIITCPHIVDGRMKTNIIITLDTLNDKDILCNETIKEVLFKDEL